MGTSPHTHNDAELHINGLKTPFTSVKTLRVTHLPLSLKAPCAAHVLSSTLKDRAAHPHDLCIVTASLSKRRWGTSSWVALCATIMKSKSCCCPFPSKSTLSLAKQSTDGPRQRVSPPTAFQSWLVRRHPVLVQGLGCPLAAPTAGPSLLTAQPCWQPAKPPRSRNLLLETRRHEMIQEESITQHLVHTVCISQPAILPISQGNGY